MADKETSPAGTANDESARQQTWHSQSVDDVVIAFKTQTDGLHESDVPARQQAYGLNRLPSHARQHPVMRFLRQFHNLLIYVLLVSALLSALLGHVVDALVIVGVTLINAIIGSIQEGKAERALEAIRALINPRATVIRSGERRTVDAECLVPGDIVLLEAGDRVPADLRLVATRNLRMEEALLTGESIAIDKISTAVAPSAPLGDRRCMAYSGTFVAGGQGRGVVVATGRDTELGRIFSLVHSVEMPKTPLVRQMDRFARQITGFILLLSLCALGFATFLQHTSFDDAFMAVVGMAVAAIPEGLPAILTITLAIGVKRMATRNAIIRHLPAVETLGSVSVICSDKTGTLTCNEMTVRAILTAEHDYDVSGAGYSPEGAISTGGVPVNNGSQPVLRDLLQAAFLCNDARVERTNGSWTAHGDPMEAALVVAARKGGIDTERGRRDCPRKDAIPFDAANRYMATLHNDHQGRAFILVKGAPERVLEMCAVEQTQDGTTRPLDLARWQDRCNSSAAQGMRLLAIASREVSRDHQDLSYDDFSNGATFLGVVGLIDPPREAAIEAIGECRSAGIRVVMITGDHVITARAIAGQLGLPNADRALVGADLDGMNDQQLQACADEVAVFARTDPEHKLRLVRALQAEGLTVAMTGDGANDAPALKRADVGISMGHGGTEVAKEASEMVLADDNFASIVHAVREGRTVYDNLRKVITWTLPTNAGEALTILAAIVAGLALPITAVQILWVNMITAVTLGTTLAFEPAEAGVMQRTPRPRSQAILSGELVWQVALVGALMTCGVFGMFWWADARGMSLEYSRTLAVNTIVLMEIAYLFSVRYVHGSSLTLRAVVGTPAVLIGVGVIAVSQLAFIYAPPFQQLFATQGLSLLDGFATLGVGAVLLFVVELEKWLRGMLVARMRARRPVI